MYVLIISRLIFTFAGWNSAVMVMEQAPAVDVVAFGLADGRIILHNLKFDKTLMEFSQVIRICCTIVWLVTSCSYLKHYK
jgi:U3 small nucleolar RNA-associated protein 21